MPTSHDPIPLVDLPAQHDEIRAEVLAAFEDTMDRGAFVGGPAVATFEAAYAEFSEVAHCVGVSNGTDALEVALRAMGFGPGDEAVLPANTFVATAEAVVRAGGTPVLADVDPDTLLVDPAAMLDAVTPRTKVLMPVHLYGQMAPVEALLEAGIPVLEDAAQSQGARRHGRRSGSVGTMAGTSFYPGKNLGAYGDAGGITTDDPDLADSARVISQHGSRVRYEHEVVGFNARLDALQAIVLTAKLKHLEKWNAARRDAAERYDGLLADALGDRVVDGSVRTLATAEGNDHVWHLYPVRVDPAIRDEVLAELHAAGIGAGIHYPVPVHHQVAFADLVAGATSFPVAEAAATRMLSLPLHPHLTVEEQERVVATFAAAVVARG